MPETKIHTLNELLFSRKGPDALKRGIPLLEEGLRHSFSSPRIPALLQDLKGTLSRELSGPVPVSLAGRMVEDVAEKYNEAGARVAHEKMPRLARDLFLGSADAYGRMPIMNQELLRVRIAAFALELAIEPNGKTLSKIRAEIRGQLDAALGKGSELQRNPVILKSPEGALAFARIVVEACACAAQEDASSIQFVIKKLENYGINLGWAKKG